MPCAQAPSRASPRLTDAGCIVQVSSRGSCALAQAAVTLDARIPEYAQKMLILCTVRPSKCLRPDQHTANCCLGDAGPGSDTARTVQP
eukprot:9491243-Pyramimonas_sp.AAC.1